MVAAFRPGGIRANAICPDLTDTPRVGELVESMGEIAARVNPMGRVAQPTDVANAKITPAQVLADMARLSARQLEIVIERAAVLRESAMRIAGELGLAAVRDRVRLRG